jgi:hypothetical protein
MKASAAPASGYPPQQTTIINEQAPSSGSSGSGTAALGAAAGAFAGAMTGAAICPEYTQPYYGVPYGRPVYRAPSNNGNSYYYYNGGNKQYIETNKTPTRCFANMTSRATGTSAISGQATRSLPRKTRTIQASGADASSTAAAMIRPPALPIAVLA